MSQDNQLPPRTRQRPGDWHQQAPTKLSWGSNYKLLTGIVIGGVVVMLALYAYNFSGSRAKELTAGDQVERAVKGIDEAQKSLVDLKTALEQEVKEVTALRKENSDLKEELKILEQVRKLFEGTKPSE